MIKYLTLVPKIIMSRIEINDTKNQKFYKHDNTYIHVAQNAMLD